MGDDPFENAIAFLEQVEKYLSAEDRPYLSRLKKPERIHKSTIEVKTSSGKKEFPAWRVQHNNALGPYKGGIRFHENVTESEVKALSLWMSLKCSVAGLPYGGGKGGVVVDPKTLSRGELEELSRAYARFIAPYIGIDTDVPAPDVNTNAQIMAWMLDEYEKIVGRGSPGAFTGKPIALGGSLGRDKATGLGGVLVLKFLLHMIGDENFSESELASFDKLKTGHSSLPPTKSVVARHSLAQTSTFDRNFIASLKGIARKPISQVTIAIQGFGNVGYHFARIASEAGFRVVAVSDSKGAIYIEEGLDPEATMKCKMEKGTLSGCYCKGGVCDLRGGKQMSNEDLLELPVDILVPAALEEVINDSNADRIKAPVIIEMANGPISETANAALQKRGVMIVPDIVANSGGVTVSYLEWVQNRTGLYWKEAEVAGRLEEMMSKSFTSVWDRYLALEEKGRSLRLAAYLVGVERIVEAEKLRKP